MLLEAAQPLLLDGDVDEWCCDEDVVEEVSDGDNNSHSHHSLQLLQYLH